jgi:hypothetical protein
MEIKSLDDEFRLFFSFPVELRKAGELIPNTTC